MKPATSRTKHIFPGISLSGGSLLLTSEKFFLTSVLEIPLRDIVAISTAVNDRTKGADKSTILTWLVLGLAGVAYAPGYWKIAGVLAWAILLLSVKYGESCVACIQCREGIIPLPTIHLVENVKELTEKLDPLILAAQKELKPHE